MRFFQNGQYLRQISPVSQVVHGGPGFPVGCSKSVSEVYRDVMGYAINCDRNLRILERYTCKSIMTPAYHHGQSTGAKKSRDLFCWLVKKPPHTFDFFDTVERIPSSSGVLRINGRRLGLLKNVYREWRDTDKYWIHSQLDRGGRIHGGFLAVVELQY